MRRSTAAAAVLVLVVALLSVYQSFVFESGSNEGRQRMVSQYKSLYGRNPPSGFPHWATFAHRHSCITDMSAYAQISRQMLPFRPITSNGDANAPSKLSPITPAVFATITDHGLAGANAHFLNGVFSLANGGKELLFSTSYETDHKWYVLDPIAHLIPRRKSFQFFINGGDEPRGVLADADAQFEYTHMSQVFDHSECMRRTFNRTLSNSTDAPLMAYKHFAGTQSIRSQHGALQHPSSFNVTNTHAPIFSQATLPCFSDIAIPLGYHIEIARNPPKDNTLWSKKRNVLFWRGSTTGGQFHADSPWQSYPRIQLMKWGRAFEKQHPDLCFDAGVPESLKQSLVREKDSRIQVDVGFSSYAGMDSSVLSQFKDLYPLKKRVSFRETMAFKYLVVVDGNSWPSRLQSYLATNSVVLYNGIFVDWYNWQLEPWVHYVPVRLDYGDLDQVLQWLRDNDDLARAISERARNLMRRINRIEQLQCYTALVLMEYSDAYDV
ncbi:glycosyl transferase family 90-domain-containing protein [Chytriomyces cf. hyalinus JEL632]|nr:glycosyl transferase family 90-domain-containing protein [Chytriomyces cf. hyalinus JEL632]